MITIRLLGRRFLRWVWHRRREAIGYWLVGLGHKVGGFDVRDEPDTQATRIPRDQLRKAKDVPVDTSGGVRLADQPPLDYVEDEFEL